MKRPYSPSLDKESGSADTSNFGGAGDNSDNDVSYMRKMREHNEMVN